MGTRWDRSAVGYWAILSAFFLAYLWLHQLAGLTFPIPWSDEGTFLWQALAFADGNTLFAPQVHPERHIMWMPPGYMVVQGLIFKLTGFSLEWARMLSAFYLLGAMAAVAAMARRPRSSLLFALLCGGFLMNRHFVFMGNIARADALMTLFVCAGFLQLQRGRAYPGVALVWLAPLVHPNGVFFCATAGVWLLAWLWKSPEKRKPSAFDLFGLAFVVVCWLGYAAYAAGRFDDLVNDMGFALTWKSSAGPLTAEFWRGWGEGEQLVHWAVLLVAAGYGARKGLVSPALLALAFGLQLLGVLAVGWMYDIQKDLLRLLLTIMTLQMLALPLAAWARSRAAWGASAVVAAFALPALGVNHHFGGLEDPRDYPFGLAYRGMSISDSPPYIEAEDRVKMRELLDSLGDERTVTRVGMYPWGETIAFSELQTERVQFYQPSFHGPNWDVMIVHDSVHIPNDPPILPTKVMRKRARGWDVVIHRDRTERWLYKNWTKERNEQR